eukprot:9984917-Alexandrium_andersonii.AAC.1
MAPLVFSLRPAERRSADSAPPSPKRHLTSGASSECHQGTRHLQLQFPKHSHRPRNPPGAPAAGG